MIRALAFLAASFLFASSAVLAPTYPSRHITLIIPFAAGGSNDIVGRAIGKKLSEAWGQPVVVENRPAPVVLSVPPSSPPRRQMATRCCWCRRPSRSTQRSRRACRLTHLRTLRPSPLLLAHRFSSPRRTISR